MIGTPPQGPGGAPTKGYTEMVYRASVAKQKHAWVKIRRIRKDIREVQMWLWVCSNCQAETWTQGEEYPCDGDETNSRSGAYCPPTAWDRIVS